MPKEHEIEKSSLDDTASIIVNIRNEFKKINSDTKRLRLVTRDLEDISSEGGVLKLFYDKSNLRKAILIAYGETGKSVTDYYFKNGKLIFIYTQNKFYDKSIYDNTQPKIQKEEDNRFYFLNEKLIRWIDKNNKIVSSKEYSRKAKELNYEVSSLLGRK